MYLCVRAYTLALLCELMVIYQKCFAGEIHYIHVIMIQNGRLVVPSDYAFTTRY